MEAVVAYMSYWPGIFLEGLRKTTISIKIADVPSETRSRHLPNTSLDCYCYANLFGELLKFVKSRMCGATWRWNHVVCFGVIRRNQAFLSAWGCSERWLSNRVRHIPLFDQTASSALHSRFPLGWPKLPTRTGSNGRLFTHTNPQDAASSASGVYCQFRLSAFSGTIAANFNSYFIFWPRKLNSCSNVLGVKRPSVWTLRW